MRTRKFSFVWMYSSYSRTRYSCMQILPSLKLLRFYFLFCQELYSVFQYLFHSISDTNWICSWKLEWNSDKKLFLVFSFSILQSVFRHYFIFSLSTVQFWICSFSCNLLRNELLRKLCGFLKKNIKSTCVNKMTHFWKFISYWHCVGFFESFEFWEKQSAKID